MAPSLKHLALRPQDVKEHLLSLTARHRVPKELAHGLELFAKLAAHP
jgi:hypothetical protein